MAFKLNSGNNPTFKMMGADSPKKKMETPMDMGHSPKKFNDKLEKAVDDGKIKGEFANAINNASDSPKEMKSPMDFGVGMMTARKIYGGDGGIETLKNIKAARNKGRSGLRKMEDDSPKQMKSPMDVAGMHTGMRRGPGIGMHQRGLFRKMEDDSAMEMESAMKLKSAMDMAKDGPMNMAKDGAMNLMEESPKKLTQDAAMKMAAAMKKFYNQD